MTSQLETQREINRLLKERTAVLQEHSEIISKQVSTAAAVQKAWEGASPKEVADHVKELNEALAEVAAKFGESSDAGSASNAKILKGLNRVRLGVTSMSTAIDVIAKKKWPAATLSVLAFVDGAIKGLKYVGSILKSTGGLVIQIAEGFADVAMSILAMPFRALDGLVSVASKLAGLMQEIATATEEVRKQFGDLSMGAGKAVIGTAHDVGKGWEKMGLGGYQIFGNLAERLRYVNQVATEMGATFENFRDEFDRSGGAILLMQKGLGLTGDDMKSLAMRATSWGTTLESQFKELTKYSRAFGKTFGIAAKLISRDMAFMVKDVKHFANMAPKELAKVSTYARRLGLDIKELTGIIDRFDTFEDAATSASMLSQAFGVQIDAIKMMNATGPDEQIDILRKAFDAAGRSIDKMDRKEMKYLSTITGLGEEQLQVALSSKKQAASLDKLNAIGAVAEKKQLSTAEAVEVLNSSIERMIKAFRPFTSFLQAFADGFARGVFMAKPMRELLTSIYNALRQTYRIGMQVGESFVSVFKGVKDVTAALNELFRVKGKEAPFRKFLDSIKDTFTRFFKGIAGGDKESAPNLIKDLRENFFTWLDPSGRGKALLSAVEKFASGVGTLLASMLTAIAREVTKGAKTLTKFLSGDIKLGDLSSGGGIASKFFAPILEAFQDEKLWSELKTALVDLFKIAWEKAKPYIKELAETFLPSISLLILGPAVVQAFVTAIASKLGEMLLSSVVSGISSGALGTTLSSIGASIASVLFSPVTLTVAAVAAVSAASVGVKQGMEEYRSTLEKEFGKTESIVASAAAGVVKVFSFGAISDEEGMALATNIAKWTTGALDYIKTLPWGESIVEGLGKMIEKGAEVFSSFGSIIEDIMMGDFDKIGDKFATLGEKFADLFITMVTDGIPTVYRALSAVSIKMWEWITTGLALVVGKAFPWLMDKFFALASGVFNFFSSFMQKIGDALSDIPVIGGFLQGTFTAIAGFFKILADLAGWVGTQFKDVLKYADYMWVGIKRWFNEGVQSIKTMLDDFVIWVGKTIDTIIEKFMNIGTSIKEGIAEGISGMTSSVSNAASGALDAIKDVFSIHSPSGEAVSIGNNIVAGLSSGMRSLPIEMEKIAARGLNDVVGLFDDSDMTSAFKNFTTPAMTVVRAMVEEANAIGEIAASISPIDVKAKLRALADRLGLKNEEFTIRSDKINLDLHLDISIEADKLVKVLSEHGVVTTDTSRVK